MNAYVMKLNGVPDSVLPRIFPPGTRDLGRAGKLGTDRTLATAHSGRKGNLWPGKIVCVRKLARIDQDCNVHREFPKVLQKPMEDLVDAFLYLGPQDLRLREKIPADIAFGRQLQNGIAARRSPVGISRRSF